MLMNALEHWDSIGPDLLDTFGESREEIEEAVKQLRLEADLSPEAVAKGEPVYVFSPLEGGWAPKKEGTIDESLYLTVMPDDSTLSTLNVRNMTYQYYDVSARYIRDTLWYTPIEGEEELYSLGFSRFRGETHKRE